MDFPKTKQCLWDTTSTGPATYLHLNYYRKPKICIPEKILRLVQHQCEHYSQWNHKLIASLVVEDDEEGVQFQVDRLDTLQAHQTDASCLVPGDLIIPFEVSNNKAKDRQGSAECYADAFNKLHQRCSSKASIELSSFMELYGWASFYSNSHTSVVHIDFDMITLETVIKATPINPIPIVLTALSKNLAGPMSLSHMQGLPKTGYLTMDHTRKLLLVLESDPKTSNLPVVGIWVSGVELVQHPFVWAACLRYIHNVHLQDRVCKATEEFLILLYTPLHSRPEFYQANTTTDKLNFQLCSGHEVTNMVKSLSSPSDNITELELGPVYDGDKIVYFDAAKAKHLVFLANKAGHFSSLAEDLQPRSAPAPHTENIPAIAPMVPDVSILWNEASPHYEPTSGMAPKQAQSHMMSPAMNSCQSNVMWNSPGPPDKLFKSPFYTQPKDPYQTQQNSATGLKYSPHQEITSAVGRKSLTFPQNSIPRPQVMNTALRQEVLRSGGPKSQASTSTVGHQSPRYPGSPLPQHYPHNAAAANSSTASNSINTTTAVQSYALHPTTPLAQHYMQNGSASIAQNFVCSANSPSVQNFIHNTSAPYTHQYPHSTSAPYVQSPSAPYTQNYVHNSSAPSYVQSPSAPYTQNYVQNSSAPSYVQSPSTPYNQNFVHNSSDPFCVQSPPAPYTQSYVPHPVTSLAQHYVHNAPPLSSGTHSNQNYVHTPRNPSNQNHVPGTPTNQDQNCAYNGPQYSLVPFSGSQQTSPKTSNGSSNTQQPAYAEPRHNNAQFLRTIVEETFSSLEPQAKEDRSESENHSAHSGEMDDDDSGLSVTPDKVNPAKQTVTSLGQDNARRDQLPVSESLKWDQVPADVRALLVQQQEQIKQLQQQIQLLMQEKSKAADPSPVVTQIPPSSAKQSPTQEILPQQFDSIEPTRPKDTAPNQVVRPVPMEPSMNCTSVDEQTSPQASVIWAGEASNSGVQAEQTMNTGLSELEIPGYVSTQDRSQFNESPSSVSDYYRNSKDDSYSTVAEDASDPKQFYHQIMSTINRMLHNSNSQSNETTNGLNESEIALQASGLNGGGSLNTTMSPHINYVSMLLGCHSDNGQSMEINAMAMKYLNDDQLTEIAKLCQSGGGKTHQIQYAAKMFQRVISSCDQSTVSPNDMTIGTRQYLEKHGLLGNDTSIIAPTLSNQSSVQDMFQLKTEFSMITDVSNGNWGSPNPKYRQTPHTNPAVKDMLSKQKENISPSIAGNRNEKWLPGRGIPRDLGASPVLHAPKEYNARQALDESFTRIRLNQNEQLKNEAVQKKNSSESLQQKEDKILDIEKLKQLPKLL